VVVIHQKIPTNLHTNGYIVKAWCVECSRKEHIPFDWVEHSIYVYGNTREEAIIRWNELFS